MSCLRHRDFRIRILGQPDYSSAPNALVVDPGVNGLVMVLAQAEMTN
jgi:hypothetical protein